MEALPRHSMMRLISRRYQHLGGCERDILAKDVKNCVYFISDGHYVKIGVATDLARRVSSLQTGNPNKLDVKCVLLFKTKREANYYEAKLHQYFKAKNILGEWFDLTDDDIMCIQKDFDLVLHRIIGV